MLRKQISRKLSFSVCVFITLNCSRVSSCNTGWGSFVEELLPDACPVLKTITAKLNDLLQSHSIEEEGPISSDLVTESLRCGRELSRAADRRGAELVRSGVNLDHSPPAIMHFFQSELSPDTKKAAASSREVLMATKLMQMKIGSSNGITPNTFMSFLEHQVIRIQDSGVCRPTAVKCSSTAKYRSIDGSCNNLKHPSWGKAATPFTRIAKPRYADGLYSMPISRSGRPLPNSRLLSTRLFFDRPVHSKLLSYMNMQWGQFITHDLVQRAMESTDEGPIQCCVGDGEDVLPPEWMNDKCIPIRVPDNDPFYSYHKVKCLNLVRSVTVTRDDCSLGPAEQMNLATSFLDASMVYGSTPKLAKKLRSKSGGKLHLENRENSIRGFLPSVDDKTKSCDLNNSSEPCYMSGDPRINQTPGLAALHTLLHREHNRVAEILGSLNPLWSDEKLYQEARKVVIAEVQHITYQEWLPLNFGSNYYRYYRISPCSLFTRDYNPDVHPGAINGFGAGALRFLHSLVPDSIATCPATYSNTVKYKLSDTYFNPGTLLERSPEGFDDVIRGITCQSAAEADPFCTAEVSNLLFKSYNQWGLDLVAMDIERGRDHGIGSYNDYREICGLRRARSFQDLIREITQDRINALKQLYECVDDIDMFVGGSLETAVEGSIVGPTFQCIMAEQFYRTRIGDRFFYDNKDMPSAFSKEQLTEIKKTSMARLICDNTDGVYYMQRRAFELESPQNAKFRCDDYSAIPAVDLTPWKKPLFDIYDL